MIFAPELIPGWLTLLGALVMAATLGFAAVTAPWRALLAAPERQHVLFGGLASLLLLWLMSVRIADGLWVHLLGVTTLTMVVGWRLTVLGGTVILLAHLWLMGLSLLAAPMAWLLTIAVPASATRALVHVLRRHGFRNLFIYLLGAGFGGGMASVLLMALTTLPLLLAIGQEELSIQAVENVPIIWFMMFPEGFLNGMLVTAVTVFWPDVVKTFDDEWYLGG